MNTWTNNHNQTLLFGYLVTDKAINRFVAACAGMFLFAVSLIASTYYNTLEACGAITVTNMPMAISIVMLGTDVLILLVLMLSELLAKD